MIRARFVTSALVSLLALGSFACGGSSTGGQGSETPNRVKGVDAGGVRPDRTPIAKLDASKAKEDSYKIEDADVPVLRFEDVSLTLSASCKKPDGTLACESYAFIRDGEPVKIQHSKLDGRVSAGTMVCTKIGKTNVTGTNAAGEQDGLCRFGDGSLVDVGSLERYSLQVVE